jgi:Flp pilus assembly protein TadG
MLDGSAIGRWVRGLTPPAWRSLRADESGSALVFAGVFLPVMAGVAMFAIDLSHIYITHDRMKVATDAAAVGAALILSDQSAATERAISLAAANVDPAWGTVTADSDIEYGSYDLKTRSFTEGTSVVNAVRVNAHRTVERGNPVATYFAALLGTPSVEIDTSSIAVQVATTCVVVLDPGIDGALTLAGSGTLSAPGCNIQVDSDSDRALIAPVGKIDAKSTCVVGGVVGTPSDPAPITGCKTLDDPLQTIPEPAPFSCQQASPLIINDMTPDCTYTGNVTISGTISLRPGTYDFRGANVTLTPTAALSGSEVFVFLDATSTLTMQSGSSLKVSPPESGPYTGLSLFQSRTAKIGALTSLGSGTGMVDMGAVYMPSSSLQIVGPAKTGKIVVGRLGVASTDTVTVAVEANRDAISPRRPTNQRTSLVY